MCEKITWTFVMARLASPRIQIGESLLFFGKKSSTTVLRLLELYFKQIIKPEVRSRALLTIRGGECGSGNADYLCRKITWTFVMARLAFPRIQIGGSLLFF